MKMKFTRQFDQMDCGPSCVRMIASSYGKNFPLSFLRTLSHLTREGVSVSGIRDAMNQIGINSATYELSIEQLRDKCPLPAILHWEQNHFVVLYEISKSKLGGRWKYKVANPAFGKQTLDEEAFERFWVNGDKGIVIACEPTEKLYEFPEMSESHSLFRFEKRFVWPFRWEMAQTACGMLFGLVLSLITPFITQTMVDDGISMRDMGIIINLMLAQLLLFIGSFTMNILSSWISLYMSVHININVLENYLGKMLRLPMAFFETKSVGDFQQRLGDNNRLQGFVTFSTLQTFFSLLSAPVLMLVIGYYNVYLFKFRKFLTSGS